MKLSKAQISNLAWPKGATHLRVVTTDGKQAVASRKSAPASLEGVDGEWKFGALVIDAKGKKEAFAPMAGDVLSAPEPQEAPAPAPGGTATQPESATPAVRPGSTADVRQRLLNLYLAGTHTKRQATDIVAHETGTDVIDVWNQVHGVAGRAKKAGVTSGSWVRGKRAGTGEGNEKRALKADRKAVIKALLDPSGAPGAKVEEFRRVFAGCKAIVVRLDV